MRALVQCMEVAQGGWAENPYPTRNFTKPRSFELRRSVKRYGEAVEAVDSVDTYPNSNVARDIKSVAAGGMYAS